MWDASGLPAVFAHRGACGACGSAPGSLGALDVLTSGGICGFDLDIFRTVDRHLVVGHPDEVQARLQLSRSPEALTLAALHGLDGGSTATVAQYLERAGASCAGRGGGLPVLLLEPKGEALRRVRETIVQVGRMAKRVEPRFIALWLEAEDVAAALAEIAGAEIAALYPIKSRHVEPSGRPLGPSDARDGAWHGAGPFWRMLTLSFAAEVRRRQQWLFAWVVDDDEATRASLAAGANAIICDDALAMRARLLVRLAQ